jgi:hypothetical protein
MRVLTSFGVAFLLSAILVSPAQAAPAAPNSFVSGPFVGSGAVFPTSDCSTHTDQQYVYGVGKPPPFSGTVIVHGCVEVTSFPFPVTGTFVITANNGATLRGSFTGLATPPPGGFTNTYTVTGGTQQFRNFTGTIAVTASVDGPIDHQTISGAFVPHLSH